MLVALLQTQVAENWSLLRDHINDSLPPIADYGPIDMNSILYTLMIGGGVVWLVQDDKQQMLGFIVTTTLRDMSGVKTLLIYSSVILQNADARFWEEGIYTLRKYAADKGCSKIAAFTNNEKIIALLREKGCETSTYVSFRL
jgi:hypothetical protein